MAIERDVRLCQTCSGVFPTLPGVPFGTGRLSARCKNRSASAPTCGRYRTPARQAELVIKHTAYRRYRSTSPSFNDVFLKAKEVDNNTPMMLDQPEKRSVNEILFFQSGTGLSCPNGKLIGPCDA